MGPVANGSSKWIPVAIATLTFLFTIVTGLGTRLLDDHARAFESHVALPMHAPGIEDYTNLKRDVREIRAQQIQDRRTLRAIARKLNVPEEEEED